jgi:phosphatidate cytidylyltransferase
MKPFFIRLILFFTLLPAIILLIILLPHYRHLALNIVLSTISVLATFETAALLEKKNLHLHREFIPLFGITLPIISYLSVIELVPQTTVVFVFFILITLIFLRESFVRKEKAFELVFHRISSNLFFLIYPSVFIAYIVMLSGFPHATFFILYFYVMVFMNDVAAYVIGSLFGKYSRKPLLVSPNKSLVGFLSGFFTSVAVAVAGWYLFPDMISAHIGRIVLLGICIGFTAIAGDLVESAMKRSAQVKDSGETIPGRGGLLDSIDSVLFSAPVFFYFMRGLVEM